MLCQHGDPEERECPETMSRRMAAGAFLPHPYSTVDNDRPDRSEKVECLPFAHFPALFETGLYITSVRSTYFCPLCTTAPSCQMECKKTSAIPSFGWTDRYGRCCRNACSMSAKNCVSPPVIPSFR